MLTNKMSYKTYNSSQLISRSCRTDGSRALKLRCRFRFLLAFFLVQGILLPIFAAMLESEASAATPLRTPLLAADAGQTPDQTGANPAVFFHQGKEALQDGKLALAEEDFQRVIALDPQSSGAHVNLAVSYMREKRWDSALAELKKADVLSPNEPGIQLNIGLAYYRKNDFASAIEPFSAILQRTPDSLQARYLLGLCYFFTSRYKEASETLAPLWPTESHNLNYLYVISIAASKSDNPALQQQSFNQMLAIGQDKPEFHLYVGKAWLAEDNTIKALEEFKAAAAAQPDLPLVHYFLGRTYLEQHADQLAETELQKDTLLNPDFAYDYEDLGVLYARLNQTDKAEHSFRQAIELDKTLVNSYIGLAKLYRRSSRFREALEMLDHAVALASQSASVHYLRAQVLTHLGDTVNAQLEFDTSAKLLKSFNDQVQQNLSGDRTADAQHAAQQ
ncbi:tetratricopeptide repeat protein [Acidicapsa acidisoli]|uniref:tetratricopeptide repeat protein n=1 Tax=Acidicapsa acidisoli TaxID=1615681 RepID=UPI0021DFE143|nr:tetratricopeptide repeat protein [Acidicapsa acidisoli]